MSNSPTLTAILNHPRVRALRPKWYRALPKCPYCGGLDVVRAAYLHCLNRECDRVFPETDEYAYEYTGPDLARPEQMHELLGLADALSAFDVDITADCVPGPEHFSAAMYSVFEGVEGFKTHRAYGPTRTDALIAAIARMLEVEK